VTQLLLVSACAGQQDMLCCHVMSWAEMTRSPHDSSESSQQ